MMPRRSTLLVASALAATTFAGCAVGPDYRRPAAPVASAFKEAGDWKAAQPSDALAKGHWWELFQDPVLNDLEQQAAHANQTLAQAVANFEQSRQLARADRATFLPSISLSGSAQRAKAGAGRTLVTSGGGSSVASSSGSRIQNSFSASAGASWTPDFWGRIRRQTEADVASAQAGAADLANAQLSVQTSVAQTYFQLRVADERVRLRQTAVDAYGRTLQIARNKYNVGIVARSDVISAQALLDAARAQLIDAGISRAQLEHALAVLVGKAPGDFALPAAPPAFTVPAVPATLASQLLERRPDVAAAERAMAAANARVGVQVAGYFPDLTLSADGGYSASILNQLFRASNRFWSIGGNVSETLLDFGRRGAEVAAARAAYAATVASYRGTVLHAFQEVEDELVSLRLLATEAEVQDAAVREAAEAAQIASNEYRAGTVDYTTVANAQVSELNNRQTALTVLQNRLIAAATLIEAIGGGWQQADLPTSSDVYAGRAEHSSAH